MSASNASAIDTSNYKKHTSSSKLQRMLIDRFHARVTAEIKRLAPATLLDAGCGEGFVAEILQQALPGLAITGFDFHEPSVKLAAERNPRGTFTQGDIYNIEQPDNSFDVVCCFEVFEHLHEPRKALKEMTRVARDAVVFSVPHEPFFCLANAARGKNWDIRPRGSDPDHRNFWSRKEYGEFVSQEATVEVLTGSFPWTICVARPKQ
jgi:ubiquinone/menaquinone biosynthesis C-methylase UbiE